MTYAQELLDPRWQKLRLFVLNRDNWTCQKCGETSKTLHVHHKIYMMGYSPWDYDHVFLISYCSDCHHDEHFSEKEVAKKEDSEPLPLEEVYKNIRERTIIAMKITGVYPAHIYELAQIRKQISERNKTAQNG